MINIEMLQRAVARWETYEDRGIRPALGWGSGEDGNSCALGDINHYEEIGGPASAVGEELGLVQMIPVKNHEAPARWVMLLHETECPAYYWLAAISDGHGRWPIAEAKRLIAWEEAARAVDAPVESTATRALRHRRVGREYVLSAVS